MNELTRAPWDPANTLLHETTAQLTTEGVNTPDGPRLAVTIRTNSTTTTVFLRKGNALAWGEKITADASRMAGVVPATMMIQEG